MIIIPADLVEAYPVRHVIELLVPEGNGLHAVAERLHLLAAGGVVVPVSVNHHLPETVVVDGLEVDPAGHDAGVGAAAGGTSCFWRLLLAWFTAGRWWSTGLCGEFKEERMSVVVRCTKHQIAV